MSDYAIAWRNGFAEGKRNADRYREALERIADMRGVDPVFDSPMRLRVIARAALEQTPALEQEQPTDG